MISNADLSKSLGRFIRTRKGAFENVQRRRSQLLEIGALTMAAKHYESKGYLVEAKNLRNGVFRVKLSTRGDPWNFSRFDVTKAADSFEIHGNLPVEDAYRTPEARFVVDAAVVPSGNVPTGKPGGGKWSSLSNGDLTTFIEAKSLVIYPMLIAQFIGIVHEIQPGFLEKKIPPGFATKGHFYPALVSLGYLHGTCKNIVDGFVPRGVLLNIVPNFDFEISQLNNGTAPSPFAP